MQRAEPRAQGRASDQLEQDSSGEREGREGGRSYSFAETHHVRVVPQVRLAGGSLRGDGSVVQ